MPLISRPWSINCFALSKIWFRCHSVDLRVVDVKEISTSIKSWLYADMFEKPSEAVMVRPASYGGLGVFSIKFKALASLIRSFLETAANPQFRRRYQQVGSLLVSIYFILNPGHKLSLAMV